jgi:hypothetical protein
MGDFGVREYPVTDNFSVPFRHFEFGADEQGGSARFAHAFYCVWEDRAPPDKTGKSSARGLFGEPSAWTRSERIQAVLQGRRHLGQQVMELLLLEPREVGAEEAEAAFARKARELISPGG